MGVDVDVLSFSAKDEYEIDNIHVYGFSHYKKTYVRYNYDIAIFHAANIKHHYFFINKFGSNFPHFLFFFHGHEVLKISKVYSKPYSYIKKKQGLIQNIYDCLKLKMWNKTFRKVAYKSWYVFVSNWMLDQFQRWVKISAKELNNRCSVIYNCIGAEFENGIYNVKTEKKYDYLSVRSDFDGSKYGVDIICKLATENPTKKFLLCGRGDYFKYHKKPDNLMVEYRALNHSEIIELLNESKCALMPTRTDAQGVMACEMASIGIPLITSDIEVCREVFQDYKNVALITNNVDRLPCLEAIYNSIKKYAGIKDTNKYYTQNTIGKEVKLIEDIFTGKL